MDFLLQSCHSADKVRAQLEEPLKLEILKRAEKDMQAEPVTVTSFIAERSVGTPPDFF